MLLAIVLFPLAGALLNGILFVITSYSIHYTKLYDMDVVCGRQEKTISTSSNLSRSLTVLHSISIKPLRFGNTDEIFLPANFSEVRNNFV